MVNASLGLLQTKPGTALGGRSRSQMPKNSVPSNMTTDKQQQHRPIDNNDRERSILSQVHLKLMPSDVSDIPDFDIFSHTESEMLLLQNAKNAEAIKKKKEEEEVKRRERSIESLAESDLFAGLEEGFDAADFTAKGKNHFRKNGGNKQLLSDATPRMFKSDAANNYYSAMQLNKVGGGNKAGSKAVSGVARKAGSLKAGSGAAGSENISASKSKSSKSLGEGNTKKLFGKSTKKKKTSKKSEKTNQSAITEEKTLEELVVEALSVAKTPEEVAQYLLAQDDDDHSGTDKKTLYAAILAKQKEHLHEKEQEQRQSAKGSVKSKRVIAAPGSPPTTIPPVTSLHCGSNEHDLLSTTSSITHNSGSPTGAEKAAASVCSVATDPASPGFSKARSRRLGNPNKKVDSDDPPIAEYPSPVCSPVEDMGYPETTKIAVPDKLKLDTDEDECEAKARISDASTAASTNPSASTNPASSIASGGEASQTRNKAKNLESQPSIIQEEELADEAIEHDLTSFKSATFDAANEDSTANNETFGNNVFEAISRGVNTMNETQHPSGAPRAPRPAADGISQARRVNDALGVTGSSIVGDKKKVGRVRSMSPMLYMKKRLVDEEQATPVKDNTNKQGSGKLRLVRSMSPSLFSEKRHDANKSKGGTSDDVSTAASSQSALSAGSRVIALPPSMTTTTNPPEDVRNTGEVPSLSAAVKEFNMSKPPRIPSRAVVAVDPTPRQQVQHIITSSSDDDGSVECSVMTSDSNTKNNQEVLQLTADGNVVATNLGGVGKTTSSANSVAADSIADDRSIEVSVFDNSETKEMAKSSQVSHKGVADMVDAATAADFTPKKTTKKKKSRMELAREKMSKHRPISPAIKVETKKGKDTPNAYAPTTTEAIELQMSMKLSPSEDTTDAADDATITSARKKAKLKKIKEYRKKAATISETNKEKKKVPQKTLDEWLVAKKRISDESEGTSDKWLATKKNSNNESSGKKNGAKNKEDEKKKVIDSCARLVSETRVDLDDLDDLLEEKRTQNGTSRSQASYSTSKMENNGTAHQTSQSSYSGPKTEASSSGLSMLDSKSVVSTTGSKKTKKSRLPSLFEDEEKEEPHKKQEEQPIPVVLMGRERSAQRKAPVKQINVFPNALEYDDADVDISLPPELEQDKKVKIWHEDGSLDGTRSKGEDTQILADKCMTCGGGAMPGQGENDTIFDINTLNEDNNTIVSNAEDDDDDDDNMLLNKKRQHKNKNDRGQSSSPSMFACGIDPKQLKNDLVYEAKEVAKDVKFGVRRSIRNLFGACDITQDGGVDFLTGTVNTTNDQLLGRVPMPKNRDRPRGSSPSSPNPQVEKMTDILNGRDKTKKHFASINTQSKQSEQEEKATRKVDEKKKLYLEKLKAVSMKHL